MNGLVIRFATLPDDWSSISSIRGQVFQIEQQVDPALDFDGHDQEAQQLLAYLDDQPIGTARIRLLTSQTAKVERVAVLEQFRGRGVGYKLMQFILKYLTDSRIETVYVNAQLPVQEFYEKLGFAPEGSVFEDAGIPHITMKKLLNKLG